MNIFDLRQALIDDYSSYIQSFIEIRNERIRRYVEQSLFEDGLLWPEPLIQLNPMFEPGQSVEEMVARGVLHPACAPIFRRAKEQAHPSGLPLQLHTHQQQALEVARGGHSYVLTTGTGSGKSLAYILPIVDYVLRHPHQPGIKAIVVYPMNALANSQIEEMKKFLHVGYPEHTRQVTFARYTGQEKQDERTEIITNPPDILLTNYVMLELILTRLRERDLLNAPQLRFLVLDELHTYRGRQGADVALLVRRVRDRLVPDGQTLQCVGTSATLAGEGSYDEQHSDVAAMASRIFGTSILPEHVIGETLVRVTDELDESSTDFRRALTERVSDFERDAPQDYEQFRHDALAIWLESTFGVIRRDGRLVRAKPLRISGESESAASLLQTMTGLTETACVRAIQRGLLAGYEQIAHPQTGRAPFAFRLHQFISKGDTVYATLGYDPERHITLQYQHFSPEGDQERILLPLSFCRECGQEYYSVRNLENTQIMTRELQELLPYASDGAGNERSQESKPGYLFVDADGRWPRDKEGIEQKVPGEWKVMQNGKERITSAAARRSVPRPLRVRRDGVIVEEHERDAIPCFFVPVPFRFCMHCGASYNFYLDNDFEKLGRLSSEGRSTATTILSLATISHLQAAQERGDADAIAPKLLSFTDNRQDASLQAGHFNDFVEIGLLRSALYHAAEEAGSGGLQHDTLTMRVFDALHLAPERYAINKELKYSAKINTEQALRNVLGYRLYLDLRRGWRITAPNLEQCGLLEIEYRDLHEACQDDDLWQIPQDDRHPQLAQQDNELLPAYDLLHGIAPAGREDLARALLDYMRRELAIKVDYLHERRQEEMRQQSSQYLVAPWAFDEDEKLLYATRLYPRARDPEGQGNYRYLSGLSGYGRYVRLVLRSYDIHIKSDDAGLVIRALLKALERAGLVVEDATAGKEGGVPGYQLSASTIIWRAGDGSKPYHDPLRMPGLPQGQEKRVNPFFRRFYQESAAQLHRLMDMHAAEHTAQVPPARREEREQAFRNDDGSNRLPILYCSPTMELGIDIRELNVVNMRNIPPTPANYAQRSGRAGRSGQPALVFSYCSTGNSHDQYFFQRPGAMVSGSVVPPRLDLANEDLVRAHVHAIWLAEARLSLGESLRDVLDVRGEHASLALLPHITNALRDPIARRRTESRTRKLVQTLQGDLDLSIWYTTTWPSTTLNNLENNFNSACERWRGLYRAAQSQRDLQNDVVRDASRPEEDKRQARRLRSEAESQLEMLTSSSNNERSELSEFYSYRYFASEGFLPGYNFPRLPLSAYIPARHAKQRDEYLSRPRFLAISEFAPRAIIYHEGSRYIINRSILQASDDHTGVRTTSAKQCPACGYLHLPHSGRSFDVCERCGEPLRDTINNLFKLQNVSTRRRDRISSDEEERQRQGYLIRTGVLFPQRQENHTSVLEVNVCASTGEPLAKLTYGQAATLWRINFGPTRRDASKGPGFVLDQERGYWEKEDEADPPDAPSSSSSPRKIRVLPYVEDTRNCLLFEPLVTLNERQMASLQAALKSAIQVCYQLEDNELAAEPLPRVGKRKILLLYEATEGGAGVLRQCVEQPGDMAKVASMALSLCHFDPVSGDDLHRAMHAREDCVAACYHCLLTYANQRDHILLNRHQIKDYLLQLTTASARRPKASSAPFIDDDDAPATPRAGGRVALHALEQQWLQQLHARKLAQPPQIHPVREGWQARPDFLYDGLAVYVDGDERERSARDANAAIELENNGIIMVRFGAQEQWDALFGEYAAMFGGA